jgi:acetyl-CoA acetyltransferase
LALTGLLTKTGVGPKSLDYVIMGTVIQEVKNQNIARDAGLAAGIPREVPSHTVTQACISSNQAICSGINLIQTGQADVVIAGGVETMSDVPIKFSKPIRERMLASRAPLMGSDWPPTATDDP